MLRAEVVGIAIVLALTGTLSNLTPARAAIEEEAGASRGTASLGDGSVEVWIDPGEAGRNDVHVQVLDAEGLADDTYEEDTIEVTLTLPDQDVGPFELDPVRAGPGHVQVVNTDVALPGEWVVSVKVRPDRFTELNAEVTVTVR